MQRVGHWTALAIIAMVAYKELLSRAEALYVMVCYLIYNIFVAEATFEIFTQPIDANRGEE